MADYNSYKQMYCKSSSHDSMCLLHPIIGDKDGIKLSYMQYTDSQTKECPLATFVKTSVYELLKKNYITLCEDDFTELKNLFIEVYNEILKANILKNEKNIDNYILDSLNVILKMRNFNIDLKNGVSLDDGIVLFNDSSSNTLSYIKYATRR